jgi:hypothetical protein
MKRDINVKDGANYAPSADSVKVVKEGEFYFAAAYLDHGHIYGQTNGLIDAGASLKYVYDPDPERLAKFVQRYPQAEIVTDFQTLLDDPVSSWWPLRRFPISVLPLGST